MTKIEWTEETWNPIIGCSKVSPGCDHCYAERMAERMCYMGNENYQRVIKCENVSPGGEFDDPDQWQFEKWNGKTHLVESAIEKPFRWKKPRTIFVCSMGDLFHESVLWSWIDEVMSIIERCPQHTFQILTKRPEIMKEFFDQSGYYPNILPNLWLGVTAENQEMADKRIPILLQIPAAKRFVSVEPMLGPIDFHHYPVKEQFRKPHLLHWVICGGESGPCARPMHPEWVLSLCMQCKRAEVPFFFKQWGEWSDTVPMNQIHKAKMVYNDGTFAENTIERGRNATLMARVGKKIAGHLLDGKEYFQKPQ